MLEAVLRSCKGFLAGAALSVAAGLYPAPVAAAPPLQNVAYSPFRDGQDPTKNIFPSRAQIEEDMPLVKRVASGVRTYGVDAVNFEIPQICDANGVDCMPGAWLGSESTAAGISANEAQVRNLITIANSGYGRVKRLSVGNETQCFSRIQKAKLVEYIRQVKAGTSLPVSTAEPYRVWIDNPDLAAACDFIIAHVHPYWENISVEQAPQWVLDRVSQVKAAYPGKEVIVGETGWPTGGASRGLAVPSEESQKSFLQSFAPLASQNNLTYFLFEMFDEKWKAPVSWAAVEATWGVARSDRTMKPAILSALDSNVVKIALTMTSYSVGSNGSEVWLVNPDGSSLMKVMDRLYFSHPSFGGGRVRFSPDGKKLAFFEGEKKPRVCDLNGAILQTGPILNRGGTDFIWSLSGQSLISANYSDLIQEWDISTGLVKPFAGFKDFAYNHNLVFSPDNSKFIFAFHTYESRYEIFSGVPGSREYKSLVKGSGTKYDEHLDLNWVDNDQFVFKVAYPGNVYLVSESSKKVTTIPAPSDSMYGLRVSPARNKIVICGAHKDEKIPQVELNARGITLEKRSASSIAWSPDGRYELTVRHNGFELRDVEGKRYPFVDVNAFPKPASGYYSREFYDAAWSSSPAVDMTPITEPNPVTNSTTQPGSDPPRGFDPTPAYAPGSSGGGGGKGAGGCSMGSPSHPDYALGILPLLIPWMYLPRSGRKQE